MAPKTDKVIEKDAPETETVDQLVARVNGVKTVLVGAITEILEATPVGNVLAVYDTGDVFNGPEIATEAADYVIAGLAQALCYNVFEGYKAHGAKSLAKAEDDMFKASEKDEWSRSEKSGEILEGRIAWCAKMDVQQSYRKALQQFVSGLYTSITGERYQGQQASNRTPVDSPEQGAIARLRARKDLANNVGLSVSS